MIPVSGGYRFGWFGFPLAGFLVPEGDLILFHFDTDRIAILEFMRQYRI
jgi:hypothetical protein